jgi:hypothetical protein
VAQRSIPLTGRSILVAYGAGGEWGGVSVDYDLTAAVDRPDETDEAMPWCAISLISNSCEHHSSRMTPAKSFG